MTRKAKTTEAADTDTPATTKKIDTVIELLRREEGATLAEMTRVTGWQPHSARAVLTGLRKKGNVIMKSKREDATCYRITNAA